MTNRPFVRFGAICGSVLLAAALLFCSHLHAGEHDTAKPCILSATAPNTEHPDAFGLEDEISLTIINGGPLIEEARQLKKDIILFIDGMPLKAVRANHRTMKGAPDELRFFIDHSDGPIALWNHFISTRGTGGLFTRKVSLSAGFEDQGPIPTLVKGNDTFTLILVRKTWFITCILLILGLLGLFLTLVVKSDILRDIGPKPETGRKPYSMSLIQMASWFFVIISSWLMLYVVKHTMNTITDTLVVLMGISAGTGLGAVTIDANRQTPTRKSQGFLRDILSDQYGISFHRFQIFAWTLVMVAVFLRQVTAYLAMPEFDSSLLILMGISSGTYLGFKVSENPGN